MEQIRVNQLATEFDIQNSVVISELKKIGVWVPSATTPVDQDIANRIRRRLQMMVELEQEEQVKAERIKEKKKVPVLRVRRTIKQLGKLRKGTPKIEERTIGSPLASSLKPRKGKGSYRRIEIDPESSPERTEVTIEDEPIIEKVEARLSAEQLEKAIQQSVSPELKKAVERTIRKVAIEKEKARIRSLEPAAREVGSLAKVKGEARHVESVQKVAAETPASELVHGAKSPEGPADESIPQPVLSPEGVEELPAVLTEQPRKEKQAVSPQEVTFSEAVTLKELSEKLGVKSKDVVKVLMDHGVIATVNQTLDQQIIKEVCQVFNAVARFVSFEESIVERERVEEKPEELVPRPPVVTVMGHVDHGKTSLLDAIRESRVAAGEAGGITQHIGAYHVEINGRKIVFLDTPGHQAFTRMRARGAGVTDLVVLVTAADDGVMPQTIEAIDHARAAKVPILVAINKIDKEGSQPKRTREQLAEHELVSEDWGGDTVMVEVSATEKTNLDLLLEMILLTADILELKANPKRSASGVVIEARLDRGRGAVATVLVHNGTLRVGDFFIAGAVNGKVRAMFDDRGVPMTEAGPSSAVEILGMQDVPQAGDGFQVVGDATRARQIGQHRQQRLREKELSRSSKISLDELYAQMETGEIKQLAIILKADTQGSVEVAEDTLHKLSADKVKIKVIHGGVGAISESDVLLASASDAIIIGFGVRPERSVQEVAERENVEIRLHTVIYELSQEIERAMVGLLEPTVKETYCGRAEVRQTFRTPKFGTVAGSYLVDGEITRNAEVRLIRDGVVIYEGKIDSLRRFKDDVNLVRAGYECGMSIINFNDIKIGDVIEAFVKEKVAPKPV